MQVIGLTGFAGAGKSTVADYLVKEYGFTRLSFAAPLKKMLRTEDPILGAKVVTDNAGRFVAGHVRLSDLINKGWTEQEIKDSSWGGEYRRLMQVLGTECIRAEEPEFWTNAAERQLTNQFGDYVFDDVRFPNEAAVITKRNTFGLWNVTRPGYEAVNGHASEQHAGSMGERLWLHNGLDLAGLHDQIDAALTITADAP